MKKKNFCPWKHEKTTQKISILKQKFRCFRNFSFTAQQPKWQNLCSKMWSIEQLYIELGVIGYHNENIIKQGEIFIGKGSLTLSEYTQSLEKVVGRKSNPDDIDKAKKVKLVSKELQHFREIQGYSHRSRYWCHRFDQKPTKVF